MIPVGPDIFIPASLKDVILTRLPGILSCGQLQHYAVLYFRYFYLGWLTVLNHEGRMGVVHSKKIVC